MHKTVVLGSLLAAASIWIALRAQPAATAPPPTAWAPPATRVLIRYGVTATQAATWRGRIEAVSTGARVLGVEGVHFIQQDRASADGNFSFSTRSWAPANQQTDLSPIIPGPRPVFPN